MSRFRSCCLPCRITPPAVRNSNGSAKLKNAALGLRQNMWRSRRYWRQLSTSASDIARLLRLGVRPGRLVGAGHRRRGELQIYVLERRAAYAQLLQALVPRERFAGEPAQQARRIVGIALHHLATRVAIAHAISSPTPWVGTQFPRWADRKHAAVLDDRPPVRQRLGLVEIVGGEQDRLPQLAQRADR